MPTSLRKIAIKAKKDTRHRFRNLYTMLDLNWLVSSFKRLNQNSASGVDRVSAETYRQNLIGNAANLVDKLKRKAYKAKLVRRKYIPKPNGKMRPLGIPATEDKLLQAGVVRILEAIYEQDFLDCSYGYRPDRGPVDAVLDAQTTFQFGTFNYVVEADIKGFFDNIDHQWLLKMLSLRIDDRALLNLIDKWLKAGILEPEGEVHTDSSGTPQGGVISPLLANVYLHYVLDLWFEKVVKKRMRGKACLYRFADDCVPRTLILEPRLKSPNSKPFNCREIAERETTGITPGA